MITIMSPSLYEQFKAIPGGKEKKYPAGHLLFYQGDVVDFFYLVISGEIQLLRSQPDGKSIILQRARIGDILAEASIISSHYHCHAVAQQSSLLFSLPVSSVQNHLNNDPELNRLWMAHLSREIQKARFRSELLSIKTVAARLDAWLNWHETVLPQKGEWKTLAEQLGVSPEALYREIGKRL